MYNKIYKEHNICLQYPLRYESRSNTNLLKEHSVNFVYLPRPNVTASA